MDLNKMKKLSLILEKKASVDLAWQFFNQYEGVSDSMEDLKQGFLAHIAEPISDIDNEYKEKYIELADEIHKKFSQAIDSIIPDLKILDKKMTDVFQAYLNHLD